MGVHSHGGISYQWMVYFRESPIKKDDDWGYPHFTKPPYIRVSARKIGFPLGAQIQCIAIPRERSGVTHILSRYKQQNIHSGLTVSKSEPSYIPWKPKSTDQSPPNRIQIHKNQQCSIRSMGKVAQQRRSAARIQTSTSPDTPAAIGTLCQLDRGRLLEWQMFWVFLCSFPMVSP